MVAKNILCLNADLLYQVCSSQTKKEIEADIGRFIKWNNRLKGMHSTRKRLNALLFSKPEFRSVFYYRTRKHKVLNALSRLFLRKAGAVEKGDINLFGFDSRRATTVQARKSQSAPKPLQSRRPPSPF